MTEHVSAAELFERYHLAVYHYFRRLTRRRDVAQDLAQEVFLRVVRDIQRYRSIGREAAWVFGIARHVLAEHRRGRQDEEQMVSGSEGVTSEAHQLLAFGIAEALDLLPHPDREMLLLREVGGFTYAEIAQIYPTSVEGVRCRLSRARGRLKDYLTRGRSSSRKHAGREPS
jgi:RNA polymerase sigma-70 factor (ECF subfamily)